MNADTLGWAATGLLTSVLAPALLLATSPRIRWDRLALPAALALPGFVAVHGLITVALAQHPPPLAWIGLHTPLLAGALIFWLPIFSRTRRLDDPLRVLYLFLAAPALDLAGLIVIVIGDAPGGIAMIVGMLPAGIISVAVTWQWIHHEEQTIASNPEVGHWTTVTPIPAPDRFDDHQ